MSRAYLRLHRLHTSPIVMAVAFFAIWFGNPTSTDAQENVANGWRAYNVGAGTKPAFDFDSDGRLHVMGITEAEPGVVWYARADSADGDWNPQTVSDGYFYGPGDLRVDSAGTAHLAWHDHDDQDPHHLSVTAGGNIQLNRISSPGHNGWDNSLALDAQGNLYQTSVNPSGFGATASLEFSVFNGSQWSHQIVPDSGSFMYGLNTSLAIDSNRDAHVVYCECADFGAPGSLNYARQDGGTWTVSTIEDTGISGRFPVIAVDDSDRTHAAWINIDGNDPNRGEVRYGVLDGGTWDIQSVDVLEDIRLGFSGARKLVSLELDSEGNPHLAYGDRSVVKYAVGDGGTTWQRETLLTSTSSAYNGLVVLRLDEVDDAPAIAFWEPEGSSGQVRLLSPEFTSIQPGDANRDGQFDQRDLFQVVRSGRFGTQSEARWEDGDWDAAPGGRLARPPQGTRRFDQADIDAALAAGFWLQGSYLDDNSAGSASVVPEPDMAWVVFIAAGCLLLCGKRQRRRRHG